MGVEQIYIEYFSKAARYLEEKKKHESQKKNPVPFRRDLRLESIAEILEGKRHITCHSYVQSEINMLMKVADSLGFKINTFTHILEGYKVADKMKAHGVGASTFADWWAYKMEVQDAIPYNAAILIKMGVVTAINSDDAEMGRRLNQEAAKVVKYGGISEEEAWKTVTLNPAKLLRLDEFTGSIKPGKDADLVLWSHSPLSTSATVEVNMIDGIVFYDKNKDRELRAELQKERLRIINTMMQQGASGKIKLKQPFAKEHKHYHCEDVEEI
jgi:imidazolonepropionase-like amidohydrolase